MIEDMREKGELRGEDIMNRERKRQDEARWEKIGKLKYNKWYGRVKGTAIPEYLKREWEKERWQRVERYRLGDKII